MDDDFDDWTDTEEWDDDDTGDDAEDDEATAGAWDTNEDDEDEDADLDDDDADDEDEDDEDEDEDEEADWDGGAVGARPEHTEPRSEQAVSAWDFGTGVAVAGWLLDRHAEKITEAVRAASPAAHDAAGSGVPAWARLDGAALDSAAKPLQPGDRLERSRLYRSLRLHADASRDLVLEARPMVEQGPVRAGGGLDWSALGFTVLHTTLVDRLPLWVLFDEREQGFSSARLLPVFVDAGPPGRAYCYVDAPTRAVHVVEWGLERHGLALADFRWAPP